MEHHDVIIVGGGVIGCAVALHLARAGRSPVLVERSQLTSGTTWHAAGLVAELRASPNLTRLARYTGELYESLDADGWPTGFRRVGALTLAEHAARLEELERQAAMGRCLGVEIETLTAAAVAERFPWLETRDLAGALYLPNDGQVSPVDVTRAMAGAARAAGAEIREMTPVTRLLARNGQITGIETATATLRSDTVVLCAGLWSRSLAAGVGVSLPLYAAEHFYAVTEPVAALPDPLPVIRNPDSSIYLKGDAGRVLAGSFEPEAKPLPEQRLPDDFSFDELPFDLDHFAPYFEAATRRVPAIAEVGVRTWFNGPESFTPDNRYLLGPTHEVDGLWVAAGFNSIGIQSAGGVGKVLTEWINDGLPPIDLWDVDVRRTHAYQAVERYLADRTRESMGLLYGMHWPHRQPESARGVCLSPVHAELEAAGAVFGELGGWERANWFARPGEKAAYEYGFDGGNWLAAARREHLAVRENVGVFDQTSFGKLRLSGAGAPALLNRISTADLDVAPGTIVYTQWCNERGGIEADVTVTRIAETEYLVVTGPATLTRDYHYLRRACRVAGNAEVFDVTRDYAVFGVMGPRARALLSSVSPDDLGDAGFAFGTSREIAIGSATVRASRITYVGELGWELYVPTAAASGVLASLREAGAPLNVVLAGYHALDSLRLEKAYRHYGHDLTDADTLLEAGLGFTAAWDKPGGFIGREALMRQREAGLDRRLAVFRLPADAPLVFHNEPIWRGGERVGHLTSGGVAHSLACGIGLGYVERPGISPAWIREGGFEIEVGGERVPARVGLRAPFDPDNGRIR